MGRKQMLSQVLFTGLATTVVFAMGCAKSSTSNSSSASSDCTEWAGNGASAGAPADKKASTYISAVAAGDWTKAETDYLLVEMDKVSNNGNADDYVFKWMDKNGDEVCAPTFEVKKPYVVKFVNRATTLNAAAEHYFTGIGFFNAIAVKQVKSSDATYKMPYLLDFELNKTTKNYQGGETLAEIHFVPVTTGAYDIICTISGHYSNDGSHHGMVTRVEIAGGAAGVIPDFELPTTFDLDLTRDSRRSGSNSAWTGVSVTSVNLTETSGSLAFASPVALNVATGSGSGYVLRFAKSSGSTGVYTVASDFFKAMVIRKIHDRDIQLKPVYLTSMEIQTGASEAYAGTDTGGTATSTGYPGRRQIDFFVIPVTAGQTYATTLSVSGGSSASTSIVTNP